MMDTSCIIFTKERQETRQRGPKARRCGGKCKQWRQRSRRRSRGAGRFELLSLRAKEVTGSRQEPPVNQAPPPSEGRRGSGGGRRQDNTPACLSLSLPLPRSPSVTLEVCDRGATSPPLPSPRSPTLCAAARSPTRHFFSSQSASGCFVLFCVAVKNKAGGGEDGWAVGVFTRMFLTEVGRRKSSDQPQ